MASRLFEFTGLAHYLKLFSPDEKYKDFQCPIILDGPSQQLFDRSGLQLKPKKTKDDKDTYYMFRRPDKKMINGNIETFGPPKVFDLEGNEGVYSAKNLIGNGSKIKIRVSVYDTIKGKGHRLEHVTVLEHIPYNKIFTPEDINDLPFEA